MKKEVDLQNLKDANNEEETKMLDFGSYYLVVCTGLIDDEGSESIIVAKFLGHNDWYADFPYNQPVNPKYFSNGLKIHKFKPKVKMKKELKIIPVLPFS